MAFASKWRAAAVLAAALATGWYVTTNQGATVPQAATLPQTAHSVPQPGDAAQAAFANRIRGQMIAVTGTIERILPDDREGSPHQRFIIRTSGGVSVLVAHNLDLAPRLQGIAPGDTVSLYGEYEWNEKGGVMHWTHDDPQGRHQAGYIDWRGRRYQ